MPCEVSDKATAYRATSSNFSWIVCYGRRVCIAIALFSTRVMFSAIERVSAKMCLAVNEGKTKYMLSTYGNVTRMASHITANSYEFDVVKEFVYVPWHRHCHKQRRQPGNHAHSNPCPLENPELVFLS